MPAFAAAGADLRFVASSGGASAVHLGKALGFQHATTDVEEVLHDAGTKLVVVSTRHDSHADYVVRALKAGKHVFVEKPLAMTTEQIERIEGAVAKAPGLLVMVGFNRRFAPHVVKLKQLLAQTSGPVAMTMTVNAGAIPKTHWTQDREAGGGRLVGEGCHFIDLLRHIAGAPIAAHHAVCMDTPERDTWTTHLTFDNGSVGAIQYFANGHKALAKERLEVFAGGRVLQLDNFRELTGHGWPGLKGQSLWRQDKGQGACAAAVLEAIKRGGAWPIPLEELLEVARTTLALDAQLAGSGSAGGRSEAGAA